jgi:hypothetical protein
MGCWLGLGTTRRCPCVKTGGEQKVTIEHVLHWGCLAALASPLPPLQAKSRSQNRRNAGADLLPQGLCPLLELRWGGSGAISGFSNVQRDA